EGAPVAVAGRITAHRDMGKSIFIDVRDQSGRVQAYAQKQALGDDQFDIFKHLDLGDFVGVRGTMFRTKTNEPSIKLESFTILSKALRPPPAKWHGLEDTEIRYRQRYLDLMANEDVRKTFKARSDIVHEIRAFFHERGYMEVETPAMQAIPGGAAAAPFKTFHNALGCEFYLRIALELYHKRLLVGGIDKLFEIGKNFRNEGLSRRHNPEFTMLEAYQAFGDYETMMETVESLVKRVALKACGTLLAYQPRRDSISAQFKLALSFLTNSDSAEFSGYAFCLSEIQECQKLLPDSKETEQLVLRALKAVQDFASSFEKENAEAHAKTIASFEEKAKHLIEKGKTLLSNNENAESVSLKIAEIQAALASYKEKHHSDKRIENLERIQKWLTPYAKRLEIDLNSPWRRAKYKELVCEVAGQDWFDVTPEERRRRAMEDLNLAGDIAKGYEDFEVTGAVFEKLVERNIKNPTFVTHLPKELVPLAKLSPDDPTTVEVFECCINGQEIAPGYTEQNDPIAQRTTLEHQAGGEQQKLDEDFLVALEHGMPPAGGIGIGIDRLCMMLLGQESIRDVILFPQLKPKA
ncbi:MAG: lysine--tRNA ligase, partial [Verrucomicrobiota bacterium]